MTKAFARLMAAVLLMVSCVFGQDIDPFPKPITENGAPLRVNVVEFASVPDAGGEAARMMLLVNEPGTRRLFVNDMRGPLYSVSYDGKTVVKYLDINAPEWGVAVQSHWFSVGSIVTWAEAGVGAVATQSFVDPGYGPRGLALMKQGQARPAG